MDGLNPHIGQQEVLDSKARFLAAITGLQGGKTTIGALWFLREIHEAHLQGRHGNWLIAAPTVKILQQSTLPKFREFFPSDWGSWKEQKQCFELSAALGGGAIFVRSTDEPDHLEGMTILGAWIDEAGQIDAEAWINIQGRLAINRGRALLTTTPYTVGWLKRDIEMKCHRSVMFDRDEEDQPIKKKILLNPTGEADIEVFKWTSAINPAFPWEEYRRAKRTMSPEIFKRRYKGEFTRLEGLVYKEFNRDKHVIPAFPIPGTWKRFGGSDFGSTNPTAHLRIAEEPEQKEDKEKRIPYRPSRYYVYREFYKSNALLRESAEFLLQEPLAYDLADPAAKQQIDELRRYWGVQRIMAAENKIEIGIERIQKLLLEDRLFFLDGCVPHTIEEIQEYHRPAASLDKPVSEKPVAVKNHAMDALKYAFSRTPKGLYSGTVARYEQTRRSAFVVEESEVDSITGY